jgi:predicted enzyme related to lactoylglutathione lyase
VNTSPATMKLQEIAQIAINAKDIARATAFYRDVLGLPLLFEVPPKMAFFNCGSIRLMLSLPENASYDHPGSILYYRVTDIEGTAATLKSRGVTFEGEPHLIAKMPDHELWMGFFKDTEGNVLALMEEKR